MSAGTRELSIPTAFAALLGFQLAGETLAALLREASAGMALPGPVIGMALFLAFLFWRGGPGDSLDAAASGMLRHLSLLFVPAAVGIVRHGETIASAGVAIVLALVVSTLLTLLVTVGVFLAVKRWSGGRGA